MSRDRTKLCCWMMATGFALVVAGCRPRGLRDNAALFERYVVQFQPRPGEGKVVPKPEALPERVYRSAERLAQEDAPLFRELVCLYLLKYQKYYLQHFNQGYSFIRPADDSKMLSSGRQNGRFYLLNRFVAFSGFGPSAEDGLPSQAVVVYCRQNMLNRPRICEELQAIATVRRPDMQN